MFLIGDSHAGSIKAGLERSVQNDMIVSWVGLTGNTCGYIQDATSGVCGEARDIMLERLQANVRADDVVVFSHAGYKFYHTDAQANQRTLLESLYTSVLQPRGAHLVIMGDPPKLSNRAYYCLMNTANCYVGKFNNDQNKQVGQLANDYSGVHYFEIFDLFCDNKWCMPNVPGTNTFAYFDDSHLTTAGSLYLWPYFCAFFMQAGIL